MEEEKDAFYVVRKGDIVGIYKNLSDCQDQVGNSVCDPSVSVFKGYSLAKETEEYLNTRGLQNATYTVNAVNVNEDLFKDLVPCPFQEINGSSFQIVGPSKIIKHESSVQEQLCRLHEGVGIATNNVAEYQAVLLGVKYALQKGFKQISVQGDSKLVVMQVQGAWKCKNDNMAMLCKQVKELKDKFFSFEIKHVYRDFNSKADAQANLGIHLRDCQVVVVDEKN
ncbi:hypothetical protein MKX01_026587 [Papaver californicum]|nr:hypothetical protein MKX01_026587 [Papaver californicum]